MNRKQRPQIEPCGRCRTAVVVTARTVRSRYAGTVLCDRCGTARNPLHDVDPYPERSGRVPKSREQLEAEVSRLLGARPGHGGDRERAEAIAARSDVLHRLAYHEAGHAVVARALGLPIAEVSIDAAHGGVNRYHADRAPVGWSTSHDAAVLLAGTMAERLWHPDTTGEGSEDDEATLRSLMAGERPPRVSLARDAVEYLLVDRAGDVEALAEALVKYRSLTGEQVDAILGQAAEARTAMAGVEVRSGRGGKPVQRHGTWVEYDPDDPPEGYDSRATRLYNEMHRAGDRGDWALSRTLQSQLAEALGVWQRPALTGANRTLDLNALDRDAFLGTFAEALGAPSLAEWEAAERSSASLAFAEVTDRNAERVARRMAERRR